MSQSAQTPSRLGSFETCDFDTPRWVKALLGRGLAPSRQEYERLSTGLLLGDLPMDQFIEAAFSSGKPAQWWSIIHQICDGEGEPPSSLTSNSPELSALIQSAIDCPFTVDWELANEGASYIHRTGTLATDVLRDMALMGGYMMSAFNQTLLMTGELEKGAGARLANTSRWWIAVTHLDANKPWGEGFKSTLRVRWVHAMVRRRLREHPAWRADIYGLPINQPDMAATYLGCSVVMLLGLRKSGVYVSSRQARAVLHLWKIIAWQMGVAKEWLVDTEAEGIVALRHFVMTHTPPDDTSLRLARALADEPLTRDYPAFTSVRRRMAWLAHLSSSAWLLGSSTFNQLGLSSPLGPWLKLIGLVPRVIPFYCQSLRPRSRRRSAMIGRQAQIRAVSRLHVDRSRVQTAFNTAPRSAD